MIVLHDIRPVLRSLPHSFACHLYCKSPALAWTACSIPHFLYSMCCVSSFCRPTSALDAYFIGTMVVLVLLRSKKVCPGHSSVIKILLR